MSRTGPPGHAVGAHTSHLPNCRRRRAHGVACRDAHGFFRASSRTSVCGPSAAGVAAPAGAVVPAGQCRYPVRQFGTPTRRDRHGDCFQTIVDVEAILWVVDLRRPPGEEDREVARLLQGIDPGTPIWLIGNKVDAAKYPEEALGLYADLAKVTREIPISAMNDPEAVYDLRQDLLDLMPEGPLYYPDNIRSDQSRSDWASELIRESAMIQLREELPYSVAVQVTDWRDADGKDRPIVISAEIWVERMNHRPMVIGKGGRMIREIGRNARRQLEIFLDHPIYLELEVVVRRDWRSDRESLRELGLES